MPLARCFKLMLRRFDAAMARLRLLMARAFDPYRPELHYMRGPGPKWHARHRSGIAGAAF
jgi:hypothetical protein